MAIAHINDSTRVEVDVDWDEVPCLIVHGQYDDLTYSSKIYTADEARRLIKLLEVFADNTAVS